MATNFSRSILQGQYPIRQRGHDKCPSHRENNLVFLCKGCKTLICSACIMTSHKEHIDSCIEIAKIAKEQRQELQDFVNDTDGMKIPKFKEEIKSARQELSICIPKYKLVSEDIKKQRDKCKLALDKITEDHLAICDKMEKASTDLLQTYITNLEDRLDNLVKLSSECKQTLQTGTAVRMYDSVLEVQDMDLDIPQTPNIDMTEFTPGNNRQSHLEQAMGKMKTPTDHLQAGSAPSGHSTHGPGVRPKQSKSTETGQASTGSVLYKLCDSPIVISKFSYPDRITSICSTPDGCAWLCDFETNTVKLINNKGQVIQKIHHTSDIRDISLDPTTGRLWFCCRVERTIWEVSTTSTPVTRFTTEGNPNSLFVTREGLVVVGTRGTERYGVVMYTADGRVLHTDTVVGSGEGLVRSITQCGVTGNIALVSGKLISGDSSDPNNYRRHIIVYNPTLQPLVHYQGEGIQAQKAVTPDKFVPATVVYDSKGNIVIADWKRNTLELISGTGKYIKTLHTNKGRRQRSVGIQKDDVLWSYLVLDTGKPGFKLLKYYSD
ncbi:uncharacterized protein LOC110455650 isoform X2 [Mizuhopecten yessoensis]|uniref:uncharacterized protein LOC110455650 isoform X2 n=1 Tax=Mizuhopecten yessoensis TaxID=6573 RepID=UPI000B45C5AE|nr:uncharacterized protein LOC110455650 isoform X2 [Mizuhopecten yessoensis]